MAISQEISYRLERLILDGGLAPEQKIPSERQLATRLGVSRASFAKPSMSSRGARDRNPPRQGSFVASMVPGANELGNTVP